METLPTLDYWMLNTIHSALEKEYEAEMKRAGLFKLLERVAKRQGEAVAKSYEEEWRSNEFTPVGKIWKALKRIEEIRESITKKAIES